jgi:hypothetical protein
MSRARLEERTGQVESLGHAVLDAHAHSFSHRGRDGSGKGNIEPAPGQRVMGVVYRLGLEQVDLLHRYEGGYEIVDVRVSAMSGQQHWQAYTYMAPKDDDGLLPLEFYLAHYLQGMQENQFPESYIEFIRRQARR